LTTLSTIHALRLSLGLLPAIVTQDPFLAPQKLAVFSPDPASSVRFYFDQPSESNLVQWNNSCVVVLERSSADVLFQGVGRRGTLHIPFRVVASSVVDGPKEVNIRIGLQAPVALDDGQPWMPAGSDIQEVLPPSRRYLALVTKNAAMKWNEFRGPVTPRFFFYACSNSQVAVGPTREIGIAALLREISSGPEFQHQSVAATLLLVWASEIAPLAQKYSPGYPADPRLYSLSRNPADLKLAATAEDLARGSATSDGSYLLALAGIWGSPRGFDPLIQSCLKPVNKADPSTLALLISYKYAFNEVAKLPLSRALDLCRLAPKYGAVFLRLVSSEQDLKVGDRKQMFEVSGLLSPWDRSLLYNKMTRGMSAEERALFPGGFSPAFRSDGSFPEEEVYRDKWRAYLGLPARAMPPPR
jgi:hypothetical protein